MNFIAPIAALLGLLAGPIILLYMLRLRRREVQVSSTLLWQQIIRDREANAPWQRLRRNLLLLLQLLILAVLVLALMRPYTEVPTVASGRTALLIDASASMNATDVQPTRFEEAKRRALDIINALGEGDTVAVVRVARGPEMLQNYTNSRDLLRAAVQNMQVSTAVADWSAALTLAVAGAQGAEKFNIVIIGDGGVPVGLNSSAYGEVRFIQVGTSDANLGITALSTANDPTAGPQIYARVNNYGSGDVTTIFSITLDGKLFSAASYTIKARNYTDIVVTNLPKEFRQVEANLTRPAGSTQPDYFALDDRAWAIYNPVSAGRVVIFTKNNKFLEQGLVSLPDWQVSKADPANGMTTAKFDLYIFDNWLPDKLPDANSLIVNPPTTAPANLFTVGSVINATKLNRVRPDDPRTRYLNFNEVNVLRFKQVTNAPWAVSLVENLASDVETKGPPLILAGEFNSRRVAVITFDLYDSDLPLKIAWPILLSNLTEWYKSPRAIKVDGSLETGQTVAIQPATDATLVRITRPDGATTTLNVDRPVLVYGDTPMSGIYAADIYKGSDVIQRESFAVNLFDAAETDITPRTPIIGSGTLTGAQAQQEIGQQELWPWVALIGLLVLVIEWYIYHRRAQAPKLRVTDLKHVRPFTRISRKP